MLSSLLSVYLFACMYISAHVRYTYSLHIWKNLHVSWYNFVSVKTARQRADASVWHGLQSLIAYNSLS